MTILFSLLHVVRLTAPYTLSGALALAVVRAFWEGARREVVRFGEDAAARAFGWLRRRLGMRP